MPDTDDAGDPRSIVEYNRHRWDELSAAGIEFSRPWLDLTPEVALQRVDPEQQLRSFGYLAGRQVLCLAASGGQQSAAFALLGAHVTVLDISENQLARDGETALHYGVSVETLRADMQDLSMFRDSTFDIVWLAHSINFVPDAAIVIAQIGRITRPNAMLRIQFTNPFVHGVWDNFTGAGYLITERYEDGAEVRYSDRRWEFTGPDGQKKVVQGPHEFRHRLSTIVNSILRAGFEISGLWEAVGNDVNAKPGSWAHFETVAPPWVTIWARRVPG